MKLALFGSYYEMSFIHYRTYNNDGGDGCCTREALKAGPRCVTSSNEAWFMKFYKLEMSIELPAML